MAIDREKFPPLYRTVAINDDGLESHSYIPGGLDVLTSSPSNDQPGANPEQFVGLAERRCPVAKLMSGSDNVQVKLVQEFSPAPPIVH
ncbi:hypothetical protein [Levilactobacillus brevis]|uniref:hypothetical protein n=1 Tax=Levilactobacillus brevis TaxID=1580 RepID=UPI000D3227CE|nr:hypothetical protein [Levilactobacillus brevis]PTV22484.1 hypothetical protein DB333_00055 [Levilactobacillus brevis]